MPVLALKDCPPLKGIDSGCHCNTRGVRRSRNSTPFTTENDAVFAPMPSASVKMATAANLQMAPHFVRKAVPARVSLYAV